jgi:hypothetical protein
LQQLGMTHYVPKDAELSKRITALTKELRETAR